MSLDKKIKTKWFIVANVIFFIAIAGLVNIDNVVKFFGGDFEETTHIMVLDEVGVYDTFSATYKNASKYIENLSNTKIEKYTKTKKDGEKEVEEDNDKILLVLDKDKNNYLKVDLISYNGVDALTETAITSTLNEVKGSLVLDKYNTSPKLLEELNTKVDVNKVRLDKKDTDKYTEQITGVVFPLIILPFFMLSMFLVGMIGAEVNEEKTSKSMEIIISNVSPKVHFFSKVIAGNLFVLIQGVLLVFYALVGLVIRILISGPNLLSTIPSEAKEMVNVITQSGIMSKIGIILPTTLILMILTFIGYSLLAGILASMTTNQEDYQQLQTPIVIISLVGYYMSMMASVFEGSIFIKVASYVPFISALLSPVLLFLGQITYIDVLISLGLMILVIWLLIKYGLRIYKVGILNYSSSNLWKKMFKAVKNKD